jgi:hypothetical protein
VGGRHRTDDLEDGYGAYRDPSSHRRGGRGKVFVPLAGAVALAVLLGVAAFVIVNRDRGGCSGEKLALPVAASPDIAPAVTRIAAGYNKKNPTVDDRCVEVSVAKQASVTVANTLTSTGQADMAVWIPDSSLWLTRIGSRSQNGAEAPEPAGSMAQSPIVLAAAQSVASGLQQTLGKASWSGVVGAANVVNREGAAKKIRVLALDPIRNAAGLGALLAASGVIRAQGQEDQLVGALKQLSTSMARSPESLMASLGVKAGRAPIGVSSEQGIWAFNSSKKPDDPVVPLYPAEGTLNLDYPIVIMAKDATLAKAADAFRAELTGQAAQKIVQDYGFRTPEGTGGPVLSADGGFAAEAPRALKAPDAKTVASLSQSWSRLNLGTRLLTLLDISGTMAYRVPGTNLTRMQVISKIAAEGLQLFPPDSELGVWEFSTHVNGKGVDYREIVSVGPLSGKLGDQTRKDAIIQRLAAIKAKATGDTGLNDTLAAAYERMTEEYQPDKINTILILTDGDGNDDPDGGLSNREILQRLRSQYDPSRPVNVLLIAFGEGAEKGRPQMDALAKATGGEAFIAKDVLEVRKFFVEGMKRRLCAPHCDG